MSSLSKHLIKNLQTTINVLTDQEENEEADTEEVQDTSNQKKSTRQSFSGGFSKPDKGKGKDTGNQSSLRRIPPASSGGDDGDVRKNQIRESRGILNLAKKLICQ